MNRQPSSSLSRLAHSNPVAAAPSHEQRLGGDVVGRLATEAPRRVGVQPPIAGLEDQREPLGAVLIAFAHALISSAQARIFQLPPTRPDRAAGYRRGRECDTGARIQQGREARSDLSGREIWDHPPSPSGSALESGRAVAPTRLGARRRAGSMA